jgi:subtilisin family serine protease
MLGWRMALAAAGKSAPARTGQLRRLSPEKVKARDASLALLAELSGNFKNLRPVVSLPPAPISTRQLTFFLKGRSGEQRWPVFARTFFRRRTFLPRRLSALERWFVITLPAVGQRPVMVKNLITLIPRGKRVESRLQLLRRREATSSPSSTPRTPQRRDGQNTARRQGAALAPLTPAERRDMQRTQKVVMRLRRAGFEQVVPSLAIRPRRAPNDPYFASSGSWKQPYDDLWGLKRIQAPAAWNVTVGSPDVVVAVVDTGIDYNHRDLQENVWINEGETGVDETGQDKRTNRVDDDGNGYVDDWRGWNFADNNNDPSDAVGHGTHMAGTIAAVGDNGTDVVGVMWQARVMALRIFRAGGEYSTDDQAAAAIRYAADNGARVTNNSWGGPGFSPVLHDAFEETYRRGVLHVAAVGNDMASLDDYYDTPASEESVIAVSALTPEDTRFYVSNYGSKIELTAPGGDNRASTFSLDAPQVSPCSILSLRSAGRDFGISVDDYLARTCGTSMAAPHVAGAAGLVFARYPDWTAEQVRARLRETAADIGSPGRDKDFGFGVVNAAAAVGADFVTVKWSWPDDDKEVLRRSYALWGEVGGTGFRSYLLEGGRTMIPQEWVRLGEGRASVRGGELARWQPDRNFPYFTVYTFRLTLNGEDSERIQLLRRVVIVLARSRKGWPKIIPLSRGDMVGPPVLADLDGDGTLEIVMPEANVKKLYAYRHDGELVWSREFNEAPSPIFRLSAADLDRDGKDEILVVSGNYLYALRGTGEVLPGWPVISLSGEQFSGLPAVADISGDRTREVIALSLSGDYQRGALYVWGINGQPLPAWPRRFDFAEYALSSRLVSDYGGITVYDVDGDGKREFLFALHRGNGKSLSEFEPRSSVVFVYDAEGRLREGWPVEIATPSSGGDTRGRFAGHGLAVGDVNGDALPEVVLALPYGRIAVLAAGGQMLPGWPRDVKRENAAPRIFIGPPVLTDLNGDGVLDIMVGERYAFAGDGRVLPGWDSLTEAGGEQVNKPVLPVNLDDNPLPEIFRLNDPPLIYRADGSELGRIYLGLVDKPDYALAADLEGDGFVELIVLSAEFGREKVFVLDTGGVVRDQGAAWRSLNGDATNTRQFPLPDVSPPQGEVEINNGAAWATSTSVSLRLSARDNRKGKIEMRLRNAGEAWSAWEPFVEVKSWTLPAGDGRKVVEAQFRDAAGNVSAVATDEIVLDTTPPRGTLELRGPKISRPGYTKRKRVRLLIFGEDGEGSGVALMRFRNAVRGQKWTRWMPFRESRVWIVRGKEGKRRVIMRLRDRAGLVSKPIRATIFVDTRPPRGSIKINNGATRTTSRQVMLELTSRDVGGRRASGVDRMKIWNAGERPPTTWENFQPSRQWVLSPGRGRKKVKVRFMDRAGNVSPAYTARILYRP